jgi:hypothetical protein
MIITKYLRKHKSKWIGDSYIGKEEGKEIVLQSCLTKKFLQKTKVLLTNSDNA